MDRITKAVNRARQERDSVVGYKRPMDKALRGKEIHIRTIPVSQEAMKENRVVVDDENNPCSHAYKVLRTRVWQQMRAHGWNTIGVTSANPGEGKSLTAVNLALGLAKMDVAQTVILVDLDMRRPSLHSYFGFWPEMGISDYLQGGAGLSEVLVQPDFGKVILLPGNMPFANSSEIISSSRMQRLLSEIKVHFPSRLVIFDLPPLLQTDDVMVFAPNVDSILFVIEEGRSTSDEIRQAIDLIKDVNLIGTVLNKSEDIMQGDGYY